MCIRDSITQYVHSTAVSVLRNTEYYAFILDTMHFELHYPIDGSKKWKDKKWYPLTHQTFLLFRRGIVRSIFVPYV